MATKPKIFFDIDAAAQANKSGVGYYSLGLLEALAATNNFNITAHYFNFLGSSKPELPKLMNVKYKSSKILHRKLFHLLRRLSINIPIELLTRQKFSFAVFPNFTSKSSLLKTPYCVTVHDLAFIKFADTVSGRNQKDLEKFVPKSIENSTFIICISRAVAHEIQEVYSGIARPIVVTHIPPAIDSSKIPQNSEDYTKKLGIEKRYILFVGNLEPRKNLLSLVRAYGQLDESVRSTYSLVISGGLGWNNQELKQAIEADSNILLTGYVDEATKYALYKESSLVVLPSLYEGYGMTAIEAMYFNKPIAVSDIPVLREVTHNLAVSYFNPTDVSSLKKALVNCLNKTATNKLKPDNFIGRLTWPAVTKQLVTRILQIIH